MRNWLAVMYLIYITMVVIVSATIVVFLGGFTEFSDLLGSASGVLTVLGRFCALLGISLLAVQVTTGAFSTLVERTYRIDLRSWHMRQGIVVYLIIAAHPVLTFLNLLVAPTGFTANRLTVASAFLFSLAQSTENHPQSVTVILVGVLAVTVLTAGSLTATRTGRSVVGSQWRKLHLLNYLAFAIALSHMLLIGEFTPAFPFLALYPVLVGVVLLSFLYRRFWASRPA